MKSVLVVSSDQAASEALAREAESLGWKSLSCSDLVPAMHALYDEQPQAVVLDLQPRRECIIWAIYDRIREVSDVPILVYVREANGEGRIAAFRKGVDDAVSEPLAPAEIMIRLHNLIRRRGLQGGSSQSRYSDGVMSYDAPSHSLSLNGKSVTLTPAESRLLMRFIAEPNRCLTTAELTSALWGQEEAGRSHGVKVYIHRLRRKIDSCSPPRPYIINLRTIGYRLQ